MERHDRALNLMIEEVASGGEEPTSRRGSDD
jgi:hypothetical protein